MPLIKNFSLEPLKKYFAIGPISFNSEYFLTIHSSIFIFRGKMISCQGQEIQKSTFKKLGLNLKQICTVFP